MGKNFASYLIIAISIVHEKITKMSNESKNILIVH